MTIHVIPTVTIHNAVDILEDANLTAEDLDGAHQYGSRIVRAAQVLREREKENKRRASEGLMLRAG